MSGFSLSTLRLPMAALGIFGVLGGLASWLVEGSFTLMPRVLLAGGILFLGLVVALDPEDVWGVLTGRSALLSGNALVIAAATLVILGLVNALGARYQAKWDLTANRQFTLSEQSFRVAETLSSPVHVRAFFDAGDSRRQDFEALMNDYAARSGGKLTYEYVDPDLRPGEAIAAGVTQYGTVVYQMGEKKQNSTGTTERDITTSLIKLTRAEKKLYFTVGHGERRFDGFEQPDYGQIRQALERDNFKVEPLNLTSTRQVPDDAAAVVIAGPTNPFLPEEKDTLRAYLDGGGKLMLLLDPGTRADFNDILQRWQVSVSGHLVIEQARALFGDSRVPVVDRYNFHATTRELRAFTFYPAATGITFPPQGPGGSSVFPLAETTDRSWAETSQGTIQQDESDPRGPFALALAIEQDVAGGGSAPGQGATRTARVFIIGSGNFVANAFMNVPAGNQDLFLNAANWLAEQDDLISVRTPDRENRTMVLTGTQMNLIVWTSQLFLPLAVLAAGLAVWWLRR